MDNGVRTAIPLSSARAAQRESSFGDSVRAAVQTILPINPRAAALAREEWMLEELDRRDRLRLVEFVCSFAWADLEIQPEERVFISRLIRRLDLNEEEDLQVQRWLESPPSLDNLDPTSIPTAHRRLFVEAIEGLIQADGAVSEEERDSFEIFRQLLAD